MSDAAPYTIFVDFPYGLDDDTAADLIEDFMAKAEAYGEVHVSGARDTPSR